MLHHPDIPSCPVDPLHTVYSDTLKKELNEERDDGRKYNPLSPSGVTACARKLSYDTINYDTPGAIPGNKFSTSMLLIFAEGHDTEKRNKRFLSKIPDLEIEDDEKKIKFLIYEDGDFKINGKVDGIISDQVAKTTKIWECKSANSYAFKEIEKTGRPKSSHYFQIQTYFLAPEVKKLGITETILHITNKDTQQYLLLTVKANEEHGEWALDRLKFLHENRGTVFAREYLVGESWNCNPKYCEFHDFCYKDINSTSLVAILEKDEVLDKYLDNKKLEKADQYKMIHHLTRTYGDAGMYQYNEFKIEVSKLKTTMSIKWTKTNNSGSTPANT